jgi:predicted dehydrogenase
MIVQYNHEYARRIRLAAIGCGGHATRNVYPTHAFSPVDLVGVCDLDRGRAEHCARSFGSRAVYTDHRQMLQQERPEAVQVVTNYDQNGHPTYPAIAIDCMRAGANVWIEKPPAASSAEIREMMAVSRQTGKFVSVGFKKMFFPANVKAKEIISQPGFGPVSSITARYPQGLPPLEQRRDGRAMQGFLDHMVHPWALLRYLAGPTESIFVQRAANGATLTSIRFASGAIGSLHMPQGTGSGSPLERTEICGPGGNIIIDNNVRVTYYRSASGPEGGYGRSGSFFEAGDGAGTAALHWEPEFSLGQLYNKGVFLLGYAPEFRYFCQCVLDNTPPQIGNLDDALELLQVFEAYCKADGQCVRIGDH